VICTGWGEPGGEWTEWGWRNEEGVDSTGKVMHKNHVYVGGSKNVCKSVPTNGQSAVHVRQLPAIYW